MLRWIGRCAVVIAGTAGAAVAGDKPTTPLVTGLSRPTAVAIGPDRRTYVAENGEAGTDGNGRIVVLQQGETVPFAGGMDEPRGMAAWVNWLYVADRTRVWKIDRKGKAAVTAPASAFPVPPRRN